MREYMFKKLMCLMVISFMSLSLIGCTGRKAVDLTPEQDEYVRSLIEMGVYHEVCSKYGLEPGVTIDGINAYDDSDTESDLYYMTFDADGSYTVVTGSDEVYSGTFTITGHIESHGAGTDSCEITPPRNGLTTLPEQTSAGD